MRNRNSRGVTLALEAVLCAAFLSSAAAAGDYLLLFFIVSTFTVAQVTRFTSMLAIIGFAQCSLERPRLRLGYLLSYFYVFVSHHFELHFLTGRLRWAL